MLQTKSLHTLINVLISKTNLIVTSLTGCCLAYTRSAGVTYFVAGAVLCSITVKAVKRIFRQPRPVHLNPTHQKITYGSVNMCFYWSSSLNFSSSRMPSTHSATITYYATYVPLACLYLPIHASLPQSTLTRVVPPLIVVPWASLISM